MLLLAKIASLLFVVIPNLQAEGWSSVWKSPYAFDSLSELCRHEFCSCDQPYVISCYCGGFELKLRRTLRNSTVLIDNCTLNLEEEVFKAEAQHLVISNSTISSINLRSFKANVTVKAQFLDNTFKSCKQNALYGISLGKGAQLIMERNTYFNYKNGCLKMEKFTEDFDVGSVEVFGVDVAQDCHCYLLHQLTTSSISIDYFYEWEEEESGVEKERDPDALIKMLLKEIR